MCEIITQYAFNNNWDIYMSDAILRPAWNHKDVQIEAVKSIIDAVKEWSEITGCAEDVKAKEYQALLTVAFMESPDSYQTGRYLEDFYEWPVDRELITILDRAFKNMRCLVPEFVHKWVTKNNIRFPAKAGQEVRVRIGEAEFTGEVVTVIQREARAIVQPKNSAQNLSIPAEEICKVFPMKNIAKKETT